MYLYWVVDGIANDGKNDILNKRKWRRIEEGRKFGSLFDDGLLYIFGLAKD